MRVTLDFETASECDLLEAGAYAYWEHPTTEVLCLCAASDDGLGWSWIPGVNDDCLEDFRRWAEDPSVIFEAHNTAFEQAGWEIMMVRQLGLPLVPPERWDDTMARCYYRGLPGALDLAARALNLSEQKDTEGRTLTLSLSKPMTAAAWELKRPDTTPFLGDPALKIRNPDHITMAEWKRRFVKGTYDRSPPTLQRVAQYCMQDVRTEMAVGRAVGPLSPYERRVWELDQRINQRGVRIDLDYVRASQAVVAEASKPLAAEFRAITGGLEPTQTKALTAWCNANGLAIDSLAKDNLKALGITGLDDDDILDDEDDDVPQPVLSVGVPDTVRRALEIRAVLGSASVKKLGRMLACVGADGRVRYTIQYHGAGTGRWAGRLFQPQNFPRGKIEGGHDPDALVSAVMYAKNDPKAAVGYINMLFGEPIAAVASGLRHAMVAAPGHEFVTGDFAGIEARVVLALAGQHDKCELIASGSNPYLDFGEIMFGHPISKSNLDEYIPAKAGVLGCGFQCGAKNFNKKFLGDTDFDLAEMVVKTYRYKWAPKVPELWEGLEHAALKAVHDRGSAQAYGIVYEYHSNWLACHLPDGQTMWYRSPTYVPDRPMPWDANDKRPGWKYLAMKTGRWKWINAYGGLLTENVVQKIARGFLCEAMFRLEAEGYPLVLTVHDECMSEVLSYLSDHKAYEQIMAQPTDYSRAIRVPIAVEGWSGSRYKK